MMKRRKKMTEAMVTIKFKESEIDMLYKSLNIMTDIGMIYRSLGVTPETIYDEAITLKDALEKIKERIQDEKEKVKQEHKEG